MTTKIISILFRAIVGAAFIFSAYAKLYPVEIFELKFVESGLAGWNAAPFMARLFISAECTLGLFLLLNIDFNITVKVIIAALILFTLYLLYRMAFLPEEEDCGCFGLILPMTPGVSAIKNGILLTLCFILLKINKTTAHWKYMKWTRLGIVTAALALPFILNPVYAAMPDAFTTDLSGTRLNIEILKEFKDENGKSVSLAPGKNILFFFSMNCRFCKLTAKKAGIMRERSKDKNLPFYFVFWGEEKEIAPFLEATHTWGIPSQPVSADVFFPLSGNSLPSIYLLENGIVVKKLGFLSFSQDEVEQFLQK